MNPIPISWCAGGALAAALLGGLAGWTVRDWKSDAEILAGLKKATQTVEDQRVVIDKAATAFDQHQQQNQSQSTTRESTIREIYRNVPVSSDCAAPAAVRSVLDNAVTSANARAAGQPPVGLPTPAASAPAAAGS